MKLLLDENVSDRIVQQIVDLFPDSTHIKATGLKEADDSVVWAWAKQNGFTILSKDTDFYQRAIVFGSPPKFIWLRVGKRCFPSCPRHAALGACLSSTGECDTAVWRKPGMSGDQ